MNEATLRALLEQVRSGELAVDGAVDRLRDLPFRDLGEAVLMSDRVLVMSERPGRIIDDFTVDLPHRDDPLLRREHWLSPTPSKSWRHQASP